MNKKTWFDHFDEDPDEELGRYVEGILGEPMHVIMPRISWMYLDWLEKNEKIDVRLFFKECEALRTPEYGCRHKVYQATIHNNFLRREKDDLPRPEWCDPALPEDLLDI